jgi:hypothetical protein
MNMKTRIIKLSTIFIIAVFSNSSWSQSVEITPSYGYQFGAKVSDYYGYLKAADSGQFGVNLAVEVRENLMGEISYLRHNSELSIK